MEKVEIEARERPQIGKGLKNLRKQGLIPAVIYGKKIGSRSIVIDRKAFVKGVLGSVAGRNAIISLKITGEKGQGISVLTQEVQRNPLTDEILHIDFRHIVMDEAIKTRVIIELIGIPAGVKDDGGVLIHGLREIEVKCLPLEIPDKFEVDVTALKIGDSLHVSDLSAVAGVEILTTPTEMIANCSPPTKEEEVAAPVPTPEEVAAAAAAPAVAEEEVKEKSAPGAPPPPPKTQK
ncbi:50S ribosomal protein L25 [Candidatus Saganbacteria bacterium]|uniref:Large ribosomal subunit protein bL25 n=1 Tax=Candidatus Saganbacteria bacterium TaxID=2575572 RepID=A0A9D6UME4_UNCSA|nr:50S ribosomal protein L25 [Candidatus Saganbacteria bacterium]